MDIAERLLPWLCCTILLASIIAFGFIASNPGRLSAFQEDLYLSRRRTRIGVFSCLLLASAVTILFGVGFVGRFSFGWGFFPLAAVPLVILGFLVYVARLPFHYSNDGDGKSPE